MQVEMDRINEGNISRRREQCRQSVWKCVYDMQPRKSVQVYIHTLTQTLKMLLYLIISSLGGHGSLCLCGVLYVISRLTGVLLNFSFFPFSKDKKACGLTMLNSQDFEPTVAIGSMKLDIWCVCILRCISAHYSFKVLLFVTVPSCQLKPVWHSSGTSLIKETFPP